MIFLHNRTMRFVTRIFWFCLWTVLLLIPFAVQAATLNVDQAADCDDVTTDSSVVPYCFIQSAIDAAASGDTINVSAGTYYENLEIISSGSSPSKSLTITGAGREDTIIDGGYTGTVLKVSSSSEFPTITLMNLSIQHGGGAFVSNYTSGVHIVGHLILDHVLIAENGSESEDDNQYYVVYVGSNIFENGSLSMSDCVVSNNYSSSVGIAATGGNTAENTIINTEFTGNSMAYPLGVAGKSINLDTVTFDSNVFRSTFASLTVSESATVTNASFTNNTATVTTASPQMLYVQAYDFRDESCEVPLLSVSGAQFLNNSAGGIRSNVSTLITDSTIDGNGSAMTHTGGVYFTGDYLNISNSTITNNEGELVGGVLLGHHNDSCLSIIQDTTIDSNTGSIGGIYNSDGILKILSSTISNNEGTSLGGIYTYNNHLKVVNSTISGNTVVNDDAEASGIAAIGGYNVEIYSSTIVNNSVTTGAVPPLEDPTPDGEPYSPSVSSGGVGNGSSAWSYTGVTMQNTILANNTVNGNPSDCYGGLQSNGYSILGTDDRCNYTADWSDYYGVLGDEVDPGVGVLADNGGPTQTHALSLDSMAFGAGDPDGCTDDEGFVLATDQRGSPRTNMVYCDIGSYELDVSTIDGDIFSKKKIIFDVLTKRMTFEPVL